jgi:hypothetical protein
MARNSTGNKSGLNKPTPAAAWRKAREEGFNITLPSGNVATLRPVALDVLVANGELPDLLIGVAAQTLWKATEPEDIANAGDLAQGFAQLVNAVIPAAFLYPRVVEEPKEDNEIGLADISFEDKVAVFNLATAGVSALKKFRERQEANVDDIPDGDGNSDQAELFDKSERTVDGPAVRSRGGLYGHGYRERGPGAGKRGYKEGAQVAT